MWMELAELFLAEGRLNDVGPCVEQAAVLFPQAHQVLYLKVGTRTLVTDRRRATKGRNNSFLSFFRADFAQQELREWSTMQQLQNFAWKPM